MKMQDLKGTTRMPDMFTPLPELGPMPEPEQPKRAKRVHLSRADQLKLGNILNEHCRKVDGYAVYDEGWNDAMVIAQFPSGVVNTSHVMKWRHEIIGILHERRPSAPQPPADPADLAKRIEELTERVAYLELWAQERPVKPFPK